MFPLLAGMVDIVLGSAVWSGRTVAAIASGLLIVPSWYIFHRLAGRGVAVVGCLLLAVIPSLVPFVVLYRIGWDLWVGAEPRLHVFLFAGVALFLRFWAEGGITAAAAAGAAFAMAYLARSEAIVVFTLMAVAGVILASLAHRIGKRRMAALAVCALAFGVAAAPYWLCTSATS